MKATITHVLELLLHLETIRKAKIHNVSSSKKYLEVNNVTVLNQNSVLYILPVRMPPCVMDWKSNGVESPTIMSHNTLTSVWHMQRQRRRWQVQQQWGVRRRYWVHSELWLNIEQVFGLFDQILVIVFKVWWQINSDDKCWLDGTIVWWHHSMMAP